MKLRLGGRACSEFENFLGDRSLAGLVVLEGECRSDFLGVISGSLHRHHARTVFRSLRLEYGLVHSLLKEEAWEFV